MGIKNLNINVDLDGDFLDEELEIMDFYLKVIAMLIKEERVEEEENRWRDFEIYTRTGKFPV